MDVKTFFTYADEFFAQLQSNLLDDSEDCDTTSETCEPPVLKYFNVCNLFAGLISFITSYKNENKIE